MTSRPTFRPSVAEAEEMLDGEVVASGIGNLYLDSKVHHKFMRKATGVTIHIVKCGEFKTWLAIWDEEGTSRLMKQEIEHRISLDTNEKESSITWIFVHNGATRLWSFKFETREQLKECVRKMRIAMWEKGRQEDFKRQPEEDQAAIDGGEDPMDEEYSSEDEDDEEVYEMQKKQFRARFDDKKTSDQKNSHLAVGMATDRAFVLRGSQIGVFKGGKDKDDVSFVTRINEVRDTRGNLFSPEKAFLHDKDTKMILMAPGDRQKAFVMDLNAGKVCEEWQGPKDFEFGALAPGTKYQTITGGSLIAGVNSNTVFRLDPRISQKNKLADNRVNKTNFQFNCLATNEEGNIGVGSAKGEIRLLSEASKIPKVLLPGLGDPIKPQGIDTTADGKWVLATCKEYLLLYNVTHKDGTKGKGTGFQKRFLKNEKPIPLKLKLSSQDLVNFKILDVDFTPARFSVGDSEEQMISTSTGPYLIVWSFTALKKNAAKARFLYKIKKLAENVVGEHFHYNSQKLVVSTKDDVVMQECTPGAVKRRRRRTEYD